MFTLHSFVGRDAIVYPINPVHFPMIFRGFPRDVDGRSHVTRNFRVYDVYDGQWNAGGGAD